MKLRRSDVTDESKKYTFNYDEIFEEDPNDPEKLLMTIPEEIRTAQGWNEGDLLKFSVDEETQTLTIIKVGEKDDSND